MHDPGAISKRLMTSAAFCCPICASIARASSHCWPRSQQLIAALHTTSHEAVLSEEGSVLMRLQGLCRVCKDLIFLRAGSGEKSQRHDGNSGFRLPNKLLPLGNVNLGSSWPDQRGHAEQGLFASYRSVAISPKKACNKGFS